MKGLMLKWCGKPKGHLVHSWLRQDIDQGLLDLQLSILLLNLVLSFCNYGFAFLLKRSIKIQVWDDSHSQS